MNMNIPVSTISIETSLPQTKLGVITPMTNNIDRMSKICKLLTTITSNFFIIFNLTSNGTSRASADKFKK